MQYIFYIELNFSNALYQEFIIYIERESVLQPIHASNALRQVPNQHLLVSTR